MAHNYNSYEKIPGWTYIKKYKTDRILEDLQVYRIATGQVNSTDYAAVLEKYGWDVSKLRTMTEDERMGELARILNIPPEEPVYYKSKVTKSKKRPQPEPCHEDSAKGQHEKEKRREAKERRKEGVALAQTADSRPLQLEFPLPGQVSVTDQVIANSSVSVFHRPVVTPPPCLSGGVTNTLGIVNYGLEDELDDGEVELSHGDSVLDDDKRSGAWDDQLSGCSLHNDQSSDSSLHSDQSNGSSLHNQSNDPSLHNDQSSNPSPIIRLSKDAPPAPITGPVCVICGRLGQYICDATDEDVCSIECKQKAETRAHSSETPISPSFSPPNPLHVTTEHHYIPGKRRFRDAVTALDSHRCPLCGKTGHLPQDCHMAAGRGFVVEEFAANGGKKQVIRCDAMGEEERERLKRIYRRCKQVRMNPESCCSKCKARNNLVFCVTCNCCYCDKNHLLEHLRDNPSHHQLYSFKLRKLIKCANPRCSKTNVYELFMCHRCSSVLYDKYYNMKTALWRPEAIRQYPSLICCEDHMTWHVMNCDGVNGMTPIVDRNCIENGYYQRDGIVNDMLF